MLLLTTLNSDLILLIYGFLGPKDRYLMASTCKSLYKLYVQELPKQAWALIHSIAGKWYRPVYYAQFECYWALERIDTLITHDKICYNVRFRNGFPTGINMHTYEIEHRLKINMRNMVFREYYLKYVYNLNIRNLEINYFMRSHLSAVNNLIIKGSSIIVKRGKYIEDDDSYPILEQPKGVLFSSADCETNIDLAGLKTKELTLMSNVSQCTGTNYNIKKLCLYFTPNLDSAAMCPNLVKLKMFGCEDIAPRKLGHLRRLKSVFLMMKDPDLVAVFESLAGQNIPKLAMKMPRSLHLYKNQGITVQKLTMYYPIGLSDNLTIKERIYTRFALRVFNFTGKITWAMQAN